MKKRILSILLAAVMVIGLLPVMALAENGETVSTVEITLDDISEVFTTAFTEGLVQNAFRSATHTNSEMYYVSSGNNWLMWMDYENYNTMTGIGDGNEMMSADKDYFLEFCINTREGYALEDEVALKINGEEVTVYNITHYSWGAYIMTAAPKVIEAVAVAGIEVNSTGHKTVYQVGDSLDLTGLTIIARKEDGTSETVAVKGYMVSGFDSWEAVTGQELTISYCGQTCSLFVDIEPLANGETFGTVEITLDDISELFTTAFTEGLVQNAIRTAVHVDSEMYYIDSSNLWLDWIDHEHGDSVCGIGDGTEMMSKEKDYLFGLSIFARDGYVFEDEIALKINGEEASVFSVTRYDWGISIETPAPKVTEAVAGIEVNSHAHKTVYVTTEELDVTDLTILVRKSDGSAETIDVAADMVSGFDSSVPVTGQVLTITYGGQTCTYTVDIMPLTGQTIGTVELTLDDISHLFTTSFTEGLVQNALRTAVQTDSYMYTNSAVSTFLVWMDYENGNTLTGIYDGTEMMSADKDYFYRFCIKTEEGYALEDEVTLIINGEEVTVFSIEHYDWGAYLNTAAPKVTVAEGFVDIPEDAWYAAPVQWAVANAITDGMDETHFCPEANCTRAQIVTFLWRAAGQPAPTATETPFVDVPEDAWFYNAVLWAVENGITDGMDETHFCPDVICTRAQAVTFLWRAVGQPAPTATETPFVDVPEDTWFYTAVLWAVENALTDGMDETHFMPENNCTRAQIVTLLWRYYV